MQSLITESTVDRLESYNRFASTYKGCSEEFKAIVAEWRYNCEYKDDDAVILIGGETNSGKSTLAHHAHELYSEGNPKYYRVASDRLTFTQAMSKASKDKRVKYKIVHYDEANINRRDAMTKWNKDLIDMYYAIRGLHIFHLWCNPSVEMIDRPFIEERIKAVIWVMSKPKGVAYVLPRKTLLRIYDRHKSLKKGVLDREARRGIKLTFKKYHDTEFSEKYDEIKEQRMVQKIDEFTKKYSAEQAETPREKREKKLMQQRNDLIRSLNSQSHKPHEIASIIGLTPRAVQVILNERTKSIT